MRITTIQHLFMFQRAKLGVALMVVTAVFFLIPAMSWAQNTPPIADAGEDQTIFVNQSTLLDGRASFDPDGDPIVSWAWAIESKPAGSSPHLPDVDLSRTTFSSNMAGDYVVSLVVGDGTDVSDPDFVTVHVVVNQPPVAVATADPASGPAPLTVQLDGTGSYDPEGEELVYLWCFDDGSLNEGGASLTHVYELPGTYTATLTVEDDRGQQDRDSIVITVTSDNNPPVVSPTATPNEGGPPLVVQFHANATDPEVDPLTYLWDFGDPASNDNTSTLPDPQHVYESPGTYVAWLTVSDGVHDVSASVTVVVAPEIELSVKSAEVKFKGPHSTMGKVELLAAFLMDEPAPGEVLSVNFDGIELFSEPFMRFEAKNNNPNVYNLREKDLFVMLDFDANTIAVVRRKLNLATLDNSNGVDVMLQVGSDDAIENIILLPAPGNKLEYLSTQ